MKNFCIYCSISVALFLTPAITYAQLPTGWKAHDKSRLAPPVVTPGTTDGVTTAPSDAMVLFDGTDLSKWTASNGQPAKWKIVEGAMESVPKSGFVRTVEEFGDCQLHVEFASPAQVKGDGQGRGNSGVFLMGAFEIQVLDSYQNETYADGSAGSIYGQHPPLVNASKMPGEWQTYDIIFRRPRFDENGKTVAPARATVLHNGVLIQDASEIFGPTNWILHKSYESMKGKTKGPVSLQDHGNPVRYRNIWIRSLEDSHVETKSYPRPAYEISPESAEKLVGVYGQNPVTFKGGKLYLKQAGSQLEMVPLSKTEFAFTKSAGKVTFEVDENGLGMSLTLALDAFGNARKAKRNEKSKRKE